MYPDANEWWVICVCMRACLMDRGPFLIFLFLILGVASMESQRYDVTLLPCLKRNLKETRRLTGDFRSPLERDVSSCSDA